MKKTVILKAILSNLFLIGLLYSCEKEMLITEVPPLENSAFLIGKWIEKEPEDIIQFAGTNHVIEFSKDHFFLKFNYWTDALSPEDNCLNSYTAYFRGGAAEVIGDSIKLSGEATDENFNYKSAECSQYAIFQETYKYKVESDKALTLNPDKEVYFQIRLEKE